MESATHYAAKHGQGPTLIHLAWARYKQQLNRNPLRTKALTSACIAGVSDVVAQKITGRKYDFRRTIKLALYGLLWSGPVVHYWQNFLQRLFQGKADLNTAVKKVVLDQLTIGPILNLAFMTYTSVVVNGIPPAIAFNAIVNNYPGAQIQGWKVWPIASLINYRFIPLQFRVLFINVIALFWSIFLILKARATGK